MEGKNVHHIRGLVEFASSAASGWMDLLYPPLCLHCQSRVAPGALLCRSCRSRLERVDKEAARHLLDRLETDWLDQIIAVWYFDKGSPIQNVQHGLKYGNRPSYGAWLGGHLVRACNDLLVDPVDLVVPVPLHRSRMLERGYNQSTQLALPVAKALGRPMREDLLMRTQITTSQISLTRAERRKNLADAFAAAHESVFDGLHVLLIDDVITTGATIESCALALKSVGARRVTAAAIGLARH